MPLPMLVSLYTQAHHSVIHQHMPGLHAYSLNLITLGELAFCLTYRMGSTACEQWRCIPFLPTFTHNLSLALSLSRSLSLSLHTHTGGRSQITSLQNSPAGSYKARVGIFALPGGERVLPHWEAFAVFLHWQQLQIRLLVSKLPVITAQANTLDRGGKTSRITLQKKLWN